VHNLTITFCGTLSTGGGRQKLMTRTDCSEGSAEAL
jgi:hypothetical protein